MTDTVDLPDVNVTAKAPTPTADPVPAGNNPTASSTYQPQAPAGGDDLTLTIGNMSWSGWQRVQLMRSMDSIPANFAIELTERYPNAADIDIKPGAACTVKLGGDLVLTGWIDRYEASISAAEHSVHVSGRSLSADLVDCAAFIGDQAPDKEQYSLSGTTTSIITQLAKAYGIKVTSQAGDGPTVPNFNINLGETSWEIIDRLTKIAQMVAYDMPDGSLMLAQAGNEAMASGFVQGVNVERADVAFTMDQRFSVYEGFGTSTAIMMSGTGGTQPPTAIAKDPDVPRFRKRIIVSQQVDASGSLLPAQVNWECARRAGRSLAVTVLCDSWRDTSNNLWAPNHLAPVSIAAVKIPSVSWVIGQVTYLKNEQGRHALLLLMPATAFLPEPLSPLGAYPMAADAGIGAANPTSQSPIDNPTGTPSTGNSTKVGGG